MKFLLVSDETNSRSNLAILVENPIPTPLNIKLPNIIMNG